MSNSIDAIRPKMLTRGSTLGVFSPSEPITAERKPKVHAGISYLESIGFNVVTAPNFLSRHYYAAGTIEERVDDIHWLLDNRKVDALIASWGGKSCNQLLPHLDYDRFHARKAVIGFSDGTCLANAIYAKTNVMSFLGPNIVGKLDESDHSDLSFLTSSRDDATLFGVGDEVITVRPGKNVGPLLGGTLNSFLMGVLHNEFEPNLVGCILFIEVTSQPPQILDQLLTFANNAHKFDNIAGLVIGNLERSKDDRDWGGRPSLEVIVDKFSHIDIPIIQTSAFGHGKQRNPILPIGGVCELDADAGELKLIKSAVN